jgi:hypothetical protein
MLSSTAQGFLVTRTGNERTFTVYRFASQY